MKLPFTAEEFLEVFKNYNTSVYPMQIVFLLAAVLIIMILFIKKNRYQKFIFSSLGLFWFWMGIVYHIAFFSKINKAAYLFGALFILQSIFLFVAGLTKSVTFSFGKNISSITGISFIIYALIIYPVIGYYSGHAYPYSPTFGLPCPTTIFTFSIFLLADKRLPFYLMVIPLLWSVIGLSAATTLGIYEDIALIIAGLIFLILNFTKPKRLSLRHAAA